MNKLQAILLFALLGGALFATGCNGNKEASKKASPDAFAVEVVAAQIDTNAKSDYYIGTVEALVAVPLSFSTVGTCESVSVAEGQFVSKGQVVATLDKSNYKNMLDIALASEKQARDAYDRLTKVYNEGSIPEIKYVDIKTKLEQATASVEMSRKNVSDCILKSPISGMVGGKNIERGAYIVPMGPVMTIYQIDNVLIKISVPENEISRIKKGERARVVVPALGNAEFTGCFEEIGAVANIISHTYDAKIRIANPQRQLKPGMVSNVFIAQAENHSVITVPAVAVSEDCGERFVYVVSADGKSVKKQAVKTGSYSRNNIIIRSGINPGDRVVVSGNQKLYDGAPVSVAN